MNWVFLVILWIHALVAVFFIGGSFFIWVVVWPATLRISTDERSDQRSKLLWYRGTREVMLNSLSGECNSRIRLESVVLTVATLYDVDNAKTPSGIIAVSISGNGSTAVYNYQRRDCQLKPHAVNDKQGDKSTREPRKKKYVFSKYYVMVLILTGHRISVYDVHRGC